MPCPAAGDGTGTASSSFWSTVPRTLQPVDAHDTTKRPRRYSDDGPSDNSAPSSPISTRSRRTATDGLSRTGQACVNCKTRKIKCDDSPGGCKNCRKYGRECIHEDRNTHDIFKRGHSRRLEAQLTNSQHEIKRLRELVERHGISPDPVHAHLSRARSFEDSSPGLVATKAGTGIATAPGGDDLHAENLQDSTHSFPGLTPPTMPVQSQKHMGIATHVGALQDISEHTGYQIGVFRIKIDILKFVPPGEGLHSEEMTWAYFVQQINSGTYRRGNCIGFSVRLPDDKTEFRRYADRYMTLFNAWLPVIPRTYLDRLIEWVYDHSDPNAAKMDPADACRIHMMLALVKYAEWSNSTGNAPGASRHNEQMRQQAFGHYTCTIRNFHHLALCQSLDTVQVAVLICAFMRHFPHPGALWMMSSWSMAIAIDMSLHRSACVLDPGNQAAASSCAAELRKCIFWSIFSLRVMSCGSLARPTGMRWEDFDIEMPEIVPDAPEDSQDRMPSDQHCSYRAGIEFMRLCELYHKAYSDIYAVRSSVRYRDSVAEIEERQAMWRRSLPISLQVRESVTSKFGPPQHELAALTERLNFFDAKLTLIIRHPDVCRNESHEWRVTNAGVCGMACVQILESANRLRSMKALELTWCAVTTCVAAMLTLLWVHGAPEKDLEDDQLQRLYHSLLQGLDLLCVAGHALGSEDKVAKMMATIISKWHVVGGMSTQAWNAAKRDAEIYLDAAAPDDSGNHSTAARGSSSETEWHYMARQQPAEPDETRDLRRESDGARQTGTRVGEAMRRELQEMLQGVPEGRLQSWDKFAGLFGDGEGQVQKQGLSFASGTAMDMDSGGIEDGGFEKATRGGERQCEELAGTLQLAALDH